MKKGAESLATSLRAGLAFGLSPTFFITQLGGKRRSDALVWSALSDDLQRRDPPANSPALGCSDLDPPANHPVLRCRTSNWG